MLDIKVCKHCRKLNNGIEEDYDIYNEFKQYVGLFREKRIDYNLEETECLGVCKGPVVKINEEVYIEVTPDKIEEILNKIL